jgi:hypothetical protein
VKDGVASRAARIELNAFFAAAVGAFPGRDANIALPPNPVPAKILKSTDYACSHDCSRDSAIACIYCDYGVVGAAP